KPLVDEKEFRRIGERPTPWPCFVIAGRDAFLGSHSKQITQIVQIITERAQQFKADKSSPSLIAEKFDLRLEDAVEWMNSTSWEKYNQMTNGPIQKVIDTLFEIKIISQKSPPERLIHV
ncbi:MAG TPA: ABC transporter substrate-binding protein, partial [Cytophagaceae bacterium]